MHPRWNEHKEVIKRLYIQERMPLSEVKRILEAEYGFPAANQASYEIAIRDKLKLIKKLKKEHWPVLYRHYEQRNEQPFDLYIDGALLYKWPQVWKELRRSRKAKIRSDTQLPDGLLLQTPLLLDQEPLPQDEMSQAFAVALDRPVANRSNANESMTSGQIRDFVRAQLDRIPWNKTRLMLLASVIGPDQVFGKYEVVGNLTFTMIPRDDFLGHVPGRALDWIPDANQQIIYARISDSNYPTVYDLSEPLKSFEALTKGLDIYHFMNRVIYLVSNDLIKCFNYNHKQIGKGLLQILVHNVPRSVIYGFFDSKSLSIRAVWDGLINLSIELQHHDAFTFLTHMVINQRLDWLEGWYPRIIVAAASSGNVELLSRLLDLNSRHETYGTLGKTLARAVLAAVESDHQDCAALIVANMSSQRLLDFHGFGNTLSGAFVWFIFNILDNGLSLEGWQLKCRIPWPKQVLKTPCADVKDRHLSLVDIFLDAGANIDFEYPPEMWDTDEPLVMRSGCPLTCLDISFYGNRLLFERIKAFSFNATSRTQITRIGVLMAALQSEDGLAKYIKSKPAQEAGKRSQFLDWILLEQFLPIYNGKVYKVNVDIARRLVEYGADLSTYFDLVGGATWFMKRLVATMQYFGLNDDGRFLLSHLIYQGGRICPEVMAQAVSREGTEVLDYLATYNAAATGKNGAVALVMAAKKNNYEAVSWLMNRSVNVNAEIGTLKGATSIFAVVVCGLRCHEMTGFGCDPNLIYWLIFGHTMEACRQLEKPASSSMIQHLVDAGAELKLSASDISPSDFICWVLGNGCQEKMFWFFMSFEAEINKISCEEWYDILQCLLWFGRYDKISKWTKDAFEALWRRHCTSDPGPLLAGAIDADLSDEIIQEMIIKTCNFEVYGTKVSMTPLQVAAYCWNQKLVSQLINLGANVNAPAHQPYGKTALQAACQWNPVSAEESRQKNHVIDFLIIHGANVNARANKKEPTALALCAMEGDMRNVLVLLEHGADPNATYHYYKWNTNFSTLDHAVEYSRLDISHLLLSVGAISGIPGETGYDGAISISDPAIRELIQQHIAEKKAPQSSSQSGGIVNEM